MQLLEAWATAQLEAIGVDGVFAPYIVGMLPSHGGDEDSVEDAKGNIYQVLMGWLAPDDEERALEFVEELAKLADNPTQLADAAKALALESKEEKQIEDDINRILSTDEELNASAPTFVPRKFLSPEVPAFHPTTSPEQTPVSSPQCPLPSQVPRKEASGDEQEDAMDGAKLDEDEDGAIMQNEDSFFWSVAYELVSHLQLKFQDIEPNRLCDLLRLVGLDVDKAHAVLKATMERESVGTGQVCRHYLQGECRRADCMFMHDTNKLTCRFWLRGTCLQAEHCVFAHDFCEYYSMDDDALGQRDYDSEDEMEPNSRALDIQAEDVFPSLQSTSKPSSSSPQPQDQTRTLRTQHAYGRDNAVSTLTMNFARAVALEPAVPRNGSYGLDPSRRLTSPAPVRRPLYHKALTNGTKWVATGQAVATQYLELREQAYEMACARNKCFMGATQAYRNGNKALAKGLSKQGHEYNAKMKHFHFLAASEIFEARNPPNQLYMDRMMDLHGLHVAEAVEFLTQMLPKFADEGVDSIYLVTGSGHHSKGPDGNARLLPAVERFLAGEGYQFTPVTDGAGFVGMLLVDLRW
ncbi:hypothetical protein PsorP6_005654 [Peronosclerospora sorghi]|uniref:Uncharacterized protein n=1 Tax=Peronosclerospora sorghi TaxID=230839 RepID=A0ACC0W910_9STRA|nr:hypothetical protein PsorP6_005654 [Peronosclerospora sorghi]